MRTTRVISAALGMILLTCVFGCNRGPSDETLTQNVQAKLRADPALALAPISVSTTAGVVTLTGGVNSDADKSRANQLAAGVEGVKSVSNNLVAKPSPTPVIIAQDDPLKTQVLANLAKYGITGIIVTVANGEVTLAGDLPRVKLQDAMKAANEAHPRKVNNKLNLK